MFRFLLSLSVIFVLTSSAHGGSNANATVTLDLVTDGGTGNQIDDGVLSGVVSGQGSKIIVEVFAKNVVTSLLGVAVTFDFNSSVLTLVSAAGSQFFSITGGDEPKNGYFGKYYPYNFACYGLCRLC